MIFSQELILSDRQAITGDTVSTNILDFGVNGTPVGGVQIPQDVGNGTPMGLLIQVTETFNGLTSLNITLETDSASGFGSAKDVVLMNVTLSELVAGYRTPIIMLPRGISERFFRLGYDVQGTNPTQGRITAGLVCAVQTA
ncbi:MAG: Bbp16 family capsid cement protein [Pseudomonadota bacterium]